MLLRFGLKQERFDKLGQWKYNEAANPEWNKQALSWPVKQNGELNEVQSNLPVNTSPTTTSSLLRHYFDFFQKS
jgi:hypothetical protein